MLCATAHKEGRGKEEVGNHPYTGLTFESRNKLRQFIKAMLKRDFDKAMFVNATGFNKCDSNAMHAEFDGHDWWDDFTTLKHVHRFPKYRKQYLEMGFTDEDITPQYNIGSEKNGTFESFNSR